MSTRKLQRPPGAHDAEPVRPGRIVFDNRGNPVWEWNTEAGDSTSVLLKQLENAELSLEPTRTFGPLDQPKAAAAQAPARPERSTPARPTFERSAPAQSRPGVSTSARQASIRPAPAPSSSAPARRVAADPRPSGERETLTLEERGGEKGFDPYNRS